MKRRSFLSRFLPKDDENSSAGGNTDTCIRVSREAMASDFQIFLNAGEYEHGVEAALAALDEVTRLEKMLSFFDSESEISRINRLAARNFVEIEPEVYDLLKKCDKMYHESAGAYDITATPLWEVWGFAKRKATFPEESVLRKTLACVGGDGILWDDENRSLKFSRDGMKISLGSVGKGFALDAAVRVLDEAGIANFLFHGGLSSVFARGARRGRKDWLVGLHHPLQADTRIMEIPLTGRALGTSGSATQFFWWQGKRFGHILDPRSGMPTENVLSVTVLTDEAADADALATAMYVMGVEKTEAYCREHPELEVIFVLPGDGGKLEIKKIGE